MKQIAMRAGFVLAVFAVAALINRNVRIPVVGDYLPK